MNRDISAPFKPGFNSVGGVALVALLWAVVGIILVVYHYQSDWQATLGLLMIGMAFCGSLAWSRFVSTKSAVLPDFLSVYLLMLFVSYTITGLGVIVSSNYEYVGMMGEHLVAYEEVPFEYQFYAELVFLLATFVFTATWLLLEKRSVLAVWHEPPPRVIWATYGLSVTIYVAVSASGINGSLGMIMELTWLFSIGAIAVLLGGNSCYALGRSRSWLPILALLPLFYFALKSGMKGEVGLVLFPVLLTIFRRPSTTNLWILSLIVAFIVLFVFPFSIEWRMANWFGDEDVGVEIVAGRVVDKWEHDGFIETAAESSAKWLARASSSTKGGLVMQIAESDGLIGTVLIEGLQTIFVPRFLWPDKPVYTPGGWFTWYLGKADSPEEATSATAMMLPTEWYWMFGWTGVVAGMAFLGLLYFHCWRFLLVRGLTSIIPLVALFALLARSGGMEEVHVIYAISSPIILVVYVVIVQQLQRIFFPGFGRLRVNRSQLN